MTNNTSFHTRYTTHATLAEAGSVARKRAGLAERPVGVRPEGGKWLVELPWHAEAEVRALLGWDTSDREGNTAEDRNNTQGRRFRDEDGSFVWRDRTAESELEAMSATDCTAEDLDAQVERDAAYYGRTVRAKLTHSFALDKRDAAVAMAKRVRGSLKRSKDGWTVTWTGRKLVERDGDAGFTAEFVPGLVRGQRDDAEDHGACSCERCCPVAARDGLMASQLRG